jgi:hypothetical protein
MGAIISIGLAVTSSRELAPIEREYRRLSEKVGRFPVDDPSKVYVLPMKAERGHANTWHFYVPENCALQCEVSLFGKSHENSFESAQESHVLRTDRLNLRLERDEMALLRFGYVNTWVKNELVVRFLRQHFDELDYSGSLQELRSFIPDSDVITLIEAKVPSRLQAEAREALIDAGLNPDQEVAVRVRIGSFKAFKLEDGQQ